MVKWISKCVGGEAGCFTNAEVVYSDKMFILLSVMYERGDLWVEINESSCVRRCSWKRYAIIRCLRSLTRIHNDSEISDFDLRIAGSSQRSTVTKNPAAHKSVSSHCCQHWLRQKFPIYKSNHFLKSVHNSETRFMHIDEAVLNPTGVFFFFF